MSGKLLLESQLYKGIVLMSMVRYLGIQLSHQSNMTTGKIYQLVIVRHPSIFLTFGRLVTHTRLYRTRSDEETISARLSKCRSQMKLNA